MSALYMERLTVHRSLFLVSSSCVENRTEGERPEPFRYLVNLVHALELGKDGKRSMMSCALSTTGRL